MDNSFELLKRTYPVSQVKRICDGYDYILKNTTEESRKELDIKANTLQRIIVPGEKYIYQVAKDNEEFTTMCVSFNNYEIIRKKMLFFDDN